MDISKLLRSPSPPAHVILDTAHAEHYRTPNFPTTTTTTTTTSTPAPHESAATRGRHDRSSGSSAGATPPAQVRDAPAKPAQARPPDHPASRTPPSPAAESTSRELARRPTPAEKARENKLRADALCEIATAQLVRCRRCRSWIKLSAKSAFDPAHWNKHRERCVRRAESIVQELREANDQTPFPADAKPPSGSSIDKVPRDRAVAAPATPPLTPEREIDDAGTTTSTSSGSVRGPCKEDSPLTQLSDASQASPPPSPPPAPTPPIPLPEPDPVFEEYLARSQRRPTRDLASPLRKNWQEWSWAALRKPVWYPEHDSDDDGDGDGGYGYGHDQDQDRDHDHERRRRRVPVSNARASPPAPERSCEGRDRTSCSPARQALRGARTSASASATDRRDVPGAAGAVGMGGSGRGRP
ncbi:hypothetical protein DAEQUDRAFT_812931 [Daedalea quercina L-15889]|uniref:Uncharacterized protein n=1 Tax=Daedalea quercina L-15889 TaxID=1314783 RepID=A0A165NUB1_9APHY|nr:hypothetical protein DAEQUDRAFT_812931 [Daedalea quercina L-15889]